MNTPSEVVLVKGTSMGKTEWNPRLGPLTSVPHWRDVCPAKVHASVNDELPPPNAPRYA